MNPAPNPDSRSSVNASAHDASAHDASAHDASAHDATSAHDDPRLAEAVDAYRNDLKAGRRPDRDALYRRFPNLGAVLAECLDALDFVHHAGHDLGGAIPKRPQPVAIPAVHETLGDFRLLREVGRGGMGVVYEALQISLDRRVALKVLPPAAVLDPRQHQRFQNEARAAACLHHPNIVPVYAVGTDGGMPFFAMQFIHGQTLARIIQSLRGEAKARAPAQDALTTPFAATAPSPDRPPRAGAQSAVRPRSARTPARPTRHTTTPEFFRHVARMGAQAARALDHAHQIGIVHRDIKPANLMLDTGGNLWVTDFGLAHFQGDPGLTLTGDIVGTVRYMSPEQALGGRGYVDQRTDVYSLGVTLYEFATLQVPFPGDDRQDVLHQVLSDDLPAARGVNPTLPPELETIIARATARNPAERYATAQDLADDLERFLDDRPIRARRPNWLVRVRKWARRHRSLVLSLAVSLALLLGGGIAGVLSYAEQQHLVARDRAALAQDMEVRELKAKQDLHQALLGRAAALRRVREPGYRQAVWHDLQQALALDVPNQSSNVIRAEVLACLGDPIGLDPVALLQAPRAQRPKITPEFEAILEKQYEAKPLCVACSPDGRFLATYGGTPRLAGMRAAPGVHLWDQFGGVRTLPAFLRHIYDLQFSADATSLVAGCEEGVIVWRILGGGMVTSFRTGSCPCVAVHPNGRLLATLGRHIELWSLNSNRLIASFEAPPGANSVEFSSDGKWMLAIERGQEQALMAWPVTQTPEKQILDGHRAGIPAVAFSPDGQAIASVSKDCTLRLWDAATGGALPLRGEHLAAIEAVAFSPDGRLVASGDIQGMVVLWDVGTGARLCQTDPDLKHPPGQVWRLQFTPAGDYLLAGGQQGIAAWPVTSEGKSVSLGKRMAIDTHHHVYDLVVHPNGNEIAFLDFKSNLQVCSFTEGAPARRLPLKSRLEVRGLNFDATGNRLTYVTRDGTLGVWDWRSGVALPPGPRVFQVALDRTGRWAAASTPNQGVLIYDMPSVKETLMLPPEGADVWSLAWNPDATRLAIGMSDGSLAVWDLEQVRATLAEFGIAIPSTRFVQAAPRFDARVPPPG
jgi:serine/threonine protein kinase/WD40 repeat protein